MIIHEIQQVLALIQGPVFRAELPVQRKSDFKQIHGIKAGIQALIALIVGDAVEHLVVHALVIVPVEHLPQEEKLRLQAVAEAPQPAQKVQVQTVGHVQAQAVNIELLYPAPDAMQKIFHHFRISQVQLHQFKVALPALIPEAIVVAVVAAEIDAEPVLIGGTLPVAQDILESPEAPAHMIENAIQHYPDTGLVQGLAHGLEILVAAQAAIDFGEIPGVIAVVVRLEYGGKINGPNVQGLQVRNPLLHLADAGRLHPVIGKRGPAEPQRIDLIKHRFVCPHSNSYSLLPQPCSLRRRSAMVF